MFNPENEIRALSGYYSIIKNYIKKYPRTLDSLNKTLSSLVIQESSVKDIEKLKSIRRRQNIVKESIGALMLLYHHVKLSTLKLGTLLTVKLEVISERFLKK